MKRIISLLFAAVVANVFVENVCAQTLINGVPWIDVRSDYGTRGTFVRIGEVGVLSFVK